MNAAGSARERVMAQREGILALAAQRGVRRIYLFGSVARGDDRPDSDADFLAEFEPGRSAFDLGGLVSDLNELLDCEVDVVTPGGLQPAVRERVLREALPL